MRTRWTIAVALVMLAIGGAWVCCDGSEPPIESETMEVAQRPSAAEKRPVEPRSRAAVDVGNAEAPEAASEPAAVPAAQPALRVGVRWEDGSEIGDVSIHVWVHGVGRNSEASLQSTATRSFELASLEGGLAVVQATVLDSHQQFNERPRTALRLVTLPSDMEIRVPRLVKLSGRVRWADTGEPIAGANAMVMSYTSAGGWHSLTTDADGMFAMRLVAGRCKVNLYGPDKGVVPMTCTSQDAAEELRFEVVRGTPISGEVLLGRFPSAPKDEATLLIPFARTGRRLRHLDALCRVSADGSFRTAPLPPDDTYDLLVRVGQGGRNVATAWGIARDVRAGTTGVRVGERIERPLTVRVVGPDGRPAGPGDEVFLTLEDDDERDLLFGQSARCDEAELARFANAPPGRLAVSADRWSTSNWTVVDPEPGATINVVVHPTRTLRGRLMDEAGRPVVVGAVSQGDPEPSSNAWGMAKLDAEGRFTLERVPSGRRRFAWSFVAGNYIAAPSMEIDLGIADTSAGDLTLTLRAPAGR